MLKRLNFILLIIVILLTVLTSCNSKNDDKAAIQIWSYEFGRYGYYSDSLSYVIGDAKLFCEKNGIPLEIFRYNENTLSYDDYVMKRNIAAAQGNMIIIEDARYINDLAKYHANYKKLDNYDSLLDAYKDKFCIPLGVGYRATIINNNAVNFYGIDINKPIITYNEYLEIKQEMKKKGARFKLYEKEFDQMIDYYLIKNELKFINYDNKIFNDNDKLKESLRNTIKGICDDLILYYENAFIKNEYLNEIYDENSELILYESKVEATPITNGDRYTVLGDSILYKTLVIDPKETFLSPFFYMHKKITNNKIYDLANYIVSDSSYLKATDTTHFYAPVFDTQKTRKLLQVNDNWEYTGTYKRMAEKGNESYIKRCELINTVYDMLVKNKETSELLASEYYSNINYNSVVFDFVTNLINELQNKKFDYKNEETNKIINNKIEEFATNFYIHFK